MSSRIDHGSDGFSGWQRSQLVSARKENRKESSDGKKFAHFRGRELGAVGRGMERRLPKQYPLVVKPRPFKDAQKDTQKHWVKVSQKAVKAKTKVLKGSLFQKLSFEKGTSPSRSPLSCIADPSNSPERERIKKRGSECLRLSRSLFSEQAKEITSEQASRKLEQNAGKEKDKNDADPDEIFLSESVAESRLSYSREKKGTYPPKSRLRTEGEEVDGQIFSLREEMSLKRHLRANVKTISHIWEKIFAYAAFYTAERKLMKGDFPMGVPPEFPIPFRFSQRTVSSFIHVYSPTKKGQKAVSLEVFRVKYLAKGFDRRYPCDAVFFTGDTTPTMVDNRRPFVSFRKAKLENRVFTIWVQFYEEWEKIPDGGEGRLAHGRERLQVFWSKKRIKITSLSELPIHLAYWGSVLGAGWNSLSEEGSWGELVQLRTTCPIEACNTYVWGLPSKQGLSREQKRVFDFLTRFEKGDYLPGFFRLPEVMEVE